MWSHCQQSLLRFEESCFKSNLCYFIENSLDTIALSYSKTEGGPYDDQVGLIRRGIAWVSDKTYKFKNPEGGLTEGSINGDKWLNSTSYRHENLFPALQKVNASTPKNWPFKLDQLDTEHPENNGLQNEDLIVWMRTAALPNFRKIYRKINHTGTFEDGLPKGFYKYDITYRNLDQQFVLLSVLKSFKIVLFTQVSKWTSLMARRVWFCPQPPS